MGGDGDLKKEISLDRFRKSGLKETSSKIIERSDGFSKLL